MTCRWLCSIWPKTGWDTTALKELTTDNILVWPIDDKGVWYHKRKHNLSCVEPHANISLTTKSRTSCRMVCQILNLMYFFDPCIFISQIKFDSHDSLTGTMLITIHLLSQRELLGKYSYINYIHYGDVIMGAVASQITSLTIVYSTFYSDAHQRKQ